MNSVKKTRNRLPTSCEECRKRKRKCDRGKPCSNCVKNDTPDACLYLKDAIEIKAAPKKPNLKNEVIRLKMKIAQLENTLKMNHIELDSMTVPESSVFERYLNEDEDKDKDQDMAALCNKFDKLVVKENNFWRTSLTGCITVAFEDQELHTMIKNFHIESQAQYDAYLKSQKIKAKDFPIEMTTFQLLESNFKNEWGINSPENFEKLNNLLALIDDINLILPTLHQVNLCITLFFNNAYELFPYIQEQIFREQIDRVLIPLPNGKCKVGITHVQNVSIISLLLIVLRFGYMTSKNQIGLTSKNFVGGNNNKEEEIPINFITIAEDLIRAIPGAESLKKKTTFRSLQVLLFCKLYEMFGNTLECNVSPTCSSLRTSELIQMARIIGIFRDPQNYSHIYSDEREWLIIRRIAYRLYQLDWMTSFDAGTQLILSENELDIKFPTITSNEKLKIVQFLNGSNVDYSIDELKRIGLDDWINYNCELEFKSSKLLRKCVYLLHATGNHASKYQLMKALDEVEKFLNNQLPSTNNIILRRNIAQFNSTTILMGCSTVKLLEIRYSIIQLLSSAQYMLFINEESNGVKITNLKKLIVRTIDWTLQSLKLVHDFTYYVKCNKDSISSKSSDSTNNSTERERESESEGENDSGNGNGNDSLNNILKKFSNQLDIFILIMLNNGVQHFLSYLGSMFFRNVKSKDVNLDVLAEEFRETVDSINVLQWLSNHPSFNLTNSLNDQFPYILFSYLKQFYVCLNSLKEEYVVCQNNLLPVKTFVVHTMQYDRKTYEQFMLGRFDVSDSPQENFDDFIGVTNINFNDLDIQIGQELEFDISKNFTTDEISRLLGNGEFSDLDLGMGIDHVPSVDDNLSIEQFSNTSDTVNSITPQSYHSVGAEIKFDQVKPTSVFEEENLF